jgi:hypothetical protein
MLYGGEGRGEEALLSQNFFLDQHPKGVPAFSFPLSAFQDFSFSAFWTTQPHPQLRDPPARLGCRTKQLLFLNFSSFLLENV